MQTARMIKKIMSIMVLALAFSFCVYADETTQQTSLTYRIVDTGVSTFYDDISVVRRPHPGKPFFGQDAQYLVNAPSYTDNG